MWPLKTSDADWFKREKIPATIPDSPLWIAKADALPDTASISDSQIVWTSGLKTWERLAQRGVWVNGCAEGLGEQETPRIKTLVGDDVQWLKLTHADAPAENGMQTLPTYRLIAKENGPSLDGKQYLFWTSGSSFERAQQLHPWLKSMMHFCGPGNTQMTLELNGVQPHIFLDHEEWLTEMCQNREQ
jgi:hydroxymethylbilane synthase